MSGSRQPGQSEFANGGVIKDELKRITGEFDLESIFQVRLNSRAMRSLGCLPDCVCLEFLDLSDNQLTDVSPLAALKRLRYLCLAGNRLSGLGGLEGCEALLELDLSGNLIACTEDLQPLSQLDSLEQLHLQDRSRGLSNPICMSAGYAKKMLEYLPGLTCLDGDRVRGSGEDYYKMCVDLELALSVLAADLQSQESTANGRNGNLGDSDAAGNPTVTSGLGAAFWTLSGDTAASKAATDEAEAAFAQAVGLVRDRELRAMLSIEQCEKELRTSKRKL